MNMSIDVCAIRVKLIELGWTQADLAKKTKLSKRAIEGILSRETASLKSLHRIANALEVDVSTIRATALANPEPKPSDSLASCSENLSEIAEVFISYSPQDRDRVFEVVRQLEQYGVSCWLDRRKTHIRRNCDVEFIAKIAACKVVIICCSDAAISSPSVKQEMQAAWKYGRYCLSLVIERVSLRDQAEYWAEGSSVIETSDGMAGCYMPLLISALAHAGVESAMRAYSALGVASAVVPQKLLGLTGLRAVAKFTDRMWPIPADKVDRLSTQGGVRGLGAPQNCIQRSYQLGSRIAIVIEAETSGHILLLDEGPEQIIYCLCPSHFALDTSLSSGRTILPRDGARYDAFVVSGKPGREHLLAIISKYPLVENWVPSDARQPAKVLDDVSVSLVLKILSDLPETEWAVMSTYFDISH